MAKRTCSIEECERAPIARGWCTTHYSRWRIHGDPRHARPTTGGPCSVENCVSPVVARGFCDLHYRRWRRHGDPLVSRTNDLFKTGVPCRVEGCDKTAKARGWCPMHYARNLQTGDPLTTKTALTPKRPWVDNQGYILHWIPGHPLAHGGARRGKVYEHRLVLYEAGIEIPPGWHVHHKNGIRTDNRIENLEALSPSDHSREHHARRSP